MGPAFGAMPVTPGWYWSAPVSHAPMSTMGVPLTVNVRGEPRWSVVMPEGMSATLPALMAGLPESSGAVSIVVPSGIVGPPLLASFVGSCGFSGEAAVPTRFPWPPLVRPLLPTPSPMKLNELAGMTAPAMSGELVL